MADYNAIDTGTEVILDPINGRVADGVRLKDVKTLSEIQSATSFLNSEVASASAVKSIVDGLEWEDISADFLSGVTPQSDNTGSLTISAFKCGKLVSLSFLASNPSSIAVGGNIYSGKASKYLPQNEVVYAFGVNGASRSLVGTFFQHDGSFVVRPYQNPSTASVQYRSYVLYVTD